MKLVSVQTGDGLQLAGLLSEASSRKTIIVHVHGMQGNFFEHAEPYASEFVNNDVTFLTGENRGAEIIKWFDAAKGSGKIIGGAYEVFEECIHDIKAWVDYAERLGYQEIWLSGHSLGTMKAAYYLNQTNDQRIKGLILWSPADNQGLVRDPEGAADHALCYPEAQTLRAAGNGRQLLSHLLWGDKVLSADTYVDLFAEESATNIFHYYDVNRGWEVVHSITVPVIAFTGANDDGIVPVIEPHAAMKLLEQQLTRSPRVKTVVFDGAEHSFNGFEAQIVDHVSDFVRQG